ncbi:MAG TPA: hypothetical protein VGG15_01900 [Terriglobales bacterium]|jgi:hypothetical protein
MKMARMSIAVMIASAALLLLNACSVHVDDNDKKNQKVDIQTPFANLKVDSSAKAVDNGIPVYPGAKLRPADKDGDNHSANINLGAFGFGLKVIAAEYDTPDAPEKVKTFYEDKMKSFGTVLVCKGHSNSGSDTHVYHLNTHKDDGDEDKKLDCSDSSGDGWEIKTGTGDNEHLVSIEQNGSGTRFGTVFIRTHGKDSDKDTL